MPPAFEFTQATKKGAKARLALGGPSGSGKTWTALTLATAWGGTIGLIDTEHRSASKYARDPVTGKGGPFEFETLPVDNYDPRDFPAMLAAATRKKFATVIVDTGSKFWDGHGGMLEQVDRAAARNFGGNQWGGWSEARPWEREMFEAMLAYPGHFIFTMRVKTEWVITTGPNGTKVPQKIGMQYVQRGGIEYEFDVVGDLDTNNSLTIAKTRCPELAGQVYHRPGADFANLISAWLDDGAPSFTALDFRAMALDPDRTFAEFRTLLQQVIDAGLEGAPITDELGSPMSLRQLVIAQGKAAEARELFQAQAAREAAAKAAASNADTSASASSRTEGEADAGTEPAGGPTAEGESKIVGDVTTRLSEAKAAHDDAALGDLLTEIGQAKNAGQIRPTTYSHLTSLVKDARVTVSRTKPQASQPAKAGAV